MTTSRSDALVLFGVTARELHLFEEWPGEEAPYERLLGDAMIGDGALLAPARTQLRPRGRWSIQSFRTTTRLVPTNAAARGPKKAAALIASSGPWHNPRPKEALG